jgi:hypothetical protein
MIRNTLTIALVITTLAGCATPVTMLRNDATGQVVRCGGGTTGSVLGGAVGYAIERSNDEECVRTYRAHGFVPIVETQK